MFTTLMNTKLKMETKETFQVNELYPPYSPQTEVNPGCYNILVRKHKVSF